MKYTHVIFDMDGTLVNTAGYTVPACCQASRELNLPVPSDEVIISSIGYSSPEFYRLLLPGLTDDKLEKYGNRVHFLEREMIGLLGEQILFPGVSDLLSYLKSQGVLLFIASTGACEYVNYALETAGVHGFFKLVECGQPRKEAMAIKIRNTSPDSSWVFIGDRFKDAEAARAAGIHSVHAGWSGQGMGERALFGESADSLDALKDLLAESAKKQI
jgi:phosphoglycolate phosphatase